MIYAVFYGIYWCIKKIICASLKKRNNKKTQIPISKATQNSQTERKEDNSTMTPKMNNSLNKNPKNQSPKKKSAIVRWIVGGFFVMFALVNGCHFSSLFLLCAAFLMFPLSFVETFLQKKNIKAIVAILLSIALFFAGILTSPPYEPTNPSVEKHREEFGNKELSSNEVARRILETFLETNNVAKFNDRQRIILIASEFDDQTLSAVAWLNSNQVDISCYCLIPFKVDNHLLIHSQKILPIADYEDFYIGIKDKVSLGKTPKRDISRRSLPNIRSLLEWGVVSDGDIIVAKGRTDEATLTGDGKVITPNGPLSLQQWLKSILGWSSVQTYAFAVQKSSGKTLFELRQNYMENMASEKENNALN